MRSGDGIWGRKAPPSPATLDQNQPDYATQVGKALGMQGTIPGHLDPRLQLAITVDDFTRREFANLRRQHFWQGRCSMAAVAGQYGFMQLATVAGNITVIPRITIYNTSAAIMAFSWGFMNVIAGGTAGAISPVDDRNLFSVQPAAIPLTVNSASAVRPLGSVVAVGIGQSLTMDVGPFVGTGQAAAAAAQAFTIKSLTQNATWEGMMEYSERFQLPTET